jgi:hypothetical protein
LEDGAEAGLGEAGEAVGEDDGGEDEEEDAEAAAPDPGEMIFIGRIGGMPVGRAGVAGDAVENGEGAEEAAGGEAGEREGGEDFRPGEEAGAEEGHGGRGLKNN